MITEGTYPFVMGGVSTCCHQLTTGIPEIRWDVLALITPAHRTRPGFTLPPNANLLPPIVVWEEQSRLPVALGDPPQHGVVEAAAKEKLKNLNLAGAFTEGDIVKKMEAAEKAASAAKSLSIWSKVLGFLSKATGIVSAGATGYVVGASAYCTGQCAAE